MFIHVHFICHVSSRRSPKKIERWIGGFHGFGWIGCKSGQSLHVLLSEIIRLGSSPVIKINVRLVMATKTSEVGVMGGGEVIPVPPMHVSLFWTSEFVPLAAEYLESYGRTQYFLLQWNRVYTFSIVMMMAVLE